MRVLRRLWKCYFASWKRMGRYVSRCLLTRPWAMGGTSHVSIATRTHPTLTARWTEEEFQEELRVFFLNSLLKAYSRHQSMISLSSCESELHAIQQIIQQSVVLCRLATRVLRILQLMTNDQSVICMVWSDSESALKLLRNKDLPRRSRHVEIKIEWVRALSASGQVVLNYLAGSKLPADLLTKCLSTEDSSTCMPS